MNKWKKAMYIVMPVVLVIWIVIALYPFTDETKHPYFTNDRPLVIAHQGGNKLAPTSTMEAFKHAESLGVDVIELDVHLSKDGYLIPIHDPTIDRTTDGTGVVNDMTLEELQQYDAGATFEDLDGELSFKDKGVKLTTLEEVFQEIPNMRWSIEMKDTNYPEVYEDVAEKLWELIEKYELEDDVIIASFDHEMVEMMRDISNDQALLVGGKQEIKKFAILQKLYLSGLYKRSMDVLQIPTKEGKVSLKDKKIIQGARKHGLDVQYWTINDPAEMKELLELGADGIITDRPDLLIEVIEENQQFKK